MSLFHCIFKTLNDQTFEAFLYGANRADACRKAFGCKVVSCVELTPHALASSVLP